MIHQYKSNGYNIVMDVESGAVHVVDDVTYDVIALFEDTEISKIVEQLSDKYDKADIEEAISEVNQLKEDGQLFTQDIYQPFIEEFKDKRQTVVKALCYILPTTVTLPANIVLQKKVNIMAEEHDEL